MRWSGMARPSLKNVLGMSRRRQRWPGPNAGAPPFRTLDRWVDLDSFIDRLREGLMVGHPDMPTFRFTREDARLRALSQIDPGTVAYG